VNTGTVATRAPVIVSGLMLVLGGCNLPDDGVQSIAFLLAPPPASETRVPPSEEETGVPVAAFGPAQGRCDADIPARQLRCTFQQLPALPALSPSSMRAQGYELRMLLWYGALTARFDARGIDRDPGGRDPDAPPPPMTPPVPRATLGPLVPDPYGAAERVLTSPDFPLDRILGGELLVVGDRADGQVVRRVALDGRVGNLVQSGTAAADDPPPTSGGHQHH
jgi:hypothetical protein